MKQGEVRALDQIKRGKRGRGEEGRRGIKKGEGKKQHRR
jgi:hypothetical protein